MKGAGGSNNGIGQRWCDSVRVVPVAVDVFGVPSFHSAVVLVLVTIDVVVAVGVVVVALEVGVVVVVAVAFLSVCIHYIKTNEKSAGNQRGKHQYYTLFGFCSDVLVSTTSVWVLASYTFKSSNTNGCSIPPPLLTKKPKLNVTF